MPLYPCQRLASTLPCSVVSLLLVLQLHFDSRAGHGVGMVLAEATTARRASTMRTIATSSSRPQIRIAHLVSDPFTSAPIEFMLRRGAQWPKGGWPDTTIDCCPSEWRTVPCSLPLAPLASPSSHRLGERRHLDTPNRSLLPDYDIVVEEHRFRPGDPTLCLFYPCKGAPDVLPVEMVNVVGRPYHAITGPFLRENNLDLVVQQAARARVLHIHGSDNIGMSNRDIYPYTFRSIRSLQGHQTAMFYIASANAWHSVISLWWAQDLVDASVKVAKRMGVTNYPTLSEDDDAAWAVEAWQSTVVNFIRSSRIRVVLVQILPSTGWQFVCRVHRAQLSGLQYYVDQSWTAGWFLDPYPPSFGDCSADEMYIAASGFLRLFHTPTSPGVNILQALPVPSIGGDQSRLPLTCMPDLTAEDFYNSQEHVEIAQADGWGLSPAAQVQYLMFAGGPSDSVCAALLALHHAIYTEGVSPSHIEQREESAFKKLVESAAQVDFRGPTGNFRFYNDSGDPEWIFHIVSQEALGDRPNRSWAIVGVISYPDGPEGDPVMTELQPLIWRDGSTGLGPKEHLGFLPDCGPNNSILVWDACQPCRPGTSYDALLRACRTCAPGQFQNSSCKSSCEIAPPGWYVADEEHPVTIARCPVGHECPLSGTITPQPCAPGRYGRESGQASCLLCPKGTYQNETGALSCESCDDVLSRGITANIASTSAASCICPEGMYRPLAADFCSDCIHGLHCSEGSDMSNLLTQPSSSPLALSSTAKEDEEKGAFPLVEPGYMTIASEPLTVYRCIPAGSCPGGLPGSCARLRDPLSVACGKCVSGAYETGNDCTDCGSADVLPLITSLFAGVFMVSVVTVAINKNVHKTPQASLMIVAVSSLLFTSLQAMGVFSSMDLPWEEPVKTMLQVTEVISFDLDLLKVSCVMGADPLRSFALRQLLAVLIIPLVLFTLLLKKYAPRWGRPRTDIGVELCNALGSFYSLFFISILVSSMDPFICYRHPGESGESVQSAPSLLCFGEDVDGNHAAMIFVGLVALSSVALPFACLCVYAIVAYPKKIRSHNSKLFLHSMRFIFFRYVPQRYYFLLVVLLRSLLLCLIPAVLRDRPASQIVLMAIVLCAYAVVTDNLRPWRVQYCNLLDVVMSHSLELLLLCGALFIPGTPQKDAIAVFSAVLAVGVLVSALGGLLYALWTRLAPSCYHYFICHHKAHAAAQARYLKVVLQKKRRNCQVFIDSDNLEELDTLFDIVKSRVRHLVVLLTADTLKRPWCIGEIVTSLRARLPVTRLQTPSFLEPTDEQCRCPETYIDVSGCNLSEYGIQWIDVSDAFAAFLGSKTSVLELHQGAHGTRRFDRAASLLLKQRLSVTSVPAVAAVQAGGVLVASHAESDEATAAAGILFERIAGEVYRTCEQGISLLCDHEHNLQTAFRAAHQAQVVVVVLSPGCMQSLTLVGIVCELMYALGHNTSAPAVISVNLPGFEFPPPSVVAEVCQSLPTLDEAFGGTLREHLSTFFKRISIFVPTHFRQQALNAQLDEVFRRVTACLKSKGGSGSHQNYS